MEVCSSTEMGAPGASHLGTGDHGPKTHRSRPRSVLVNGHPLGCVVAVGEKCTDSHPENSIVDVKPASRRVDLDLDLEPLNTTASGRMYNCRSVGGGVAMSDIASIVREWQGRFEGQLLTPSDGNYETSRRIWNGMIDRRPSLIARCGSHKDVSVAVRLARAEKMQVSVRGGGHGVDRKSTRLNSSHLG